MKLQRPINQFLSAIIMALFIVNPASAQSIIPIKGPPDSDASPEPDIPKGRLKVVLQEKTAQGEILIRKSGGYVSVWGPYMRENPNKKGDKYRVPPGQKLRQMKGREYARGHFVFYNLPVYSDRHDPRYDWMYQVVKWGHPDYQPEGGFYVYPSGSKEIRNVDVIPRINARATGPGDTSNIIRMSGEHTLSLLKPTPPPKQSQPQVFSGGLTGGVRNLAQVAAPQPHPYTIVIVADTKATKAGLDFEPYARTVWPFSAMRDQLAIKVVTAPDYIMGCYRDNTPLKLIQCNDGFISNIGTFNGADVVVALSSSVGTGGNAPYGGFVTHAGASPGDTDLTILHELGHAIAGFNDEYAYREKKYINAYCHNPHRAVNVASFVDKQNYSSDREARKRYASLMPWFPDITSSQPIAQFHQATDIDIMIGRKQGWNLVCLVCSAKNGSQAVLYGKSNSRYDKTRPLFIMRGRDNTHGHVF